jgi:twitching motility protein PilT
MEGESKMSTSEQHVKERLDRWLAMLLEANGSDLHLKSNGNIRARVKGDIILLSDEIIDLKSMEELALLLTGDKYQSFNKTKEFDGAYSLNETYRFRINIYRHFAGLAIVFRSIPPTIQSIESLNLPNILRNFTNLRRGLILVTGSTGNGKSTTVASIVNEINENHQYHIITIEDPVEYAYTDKKSIVEQRELGTHTNSFDAALRSAVREDPDVIVVGEIRDFETADSILQAADAGYLVFSTLNTLDTLDTIERMISIFPTNKQNRVRMTLATTLEGVISQRLLKGVSGELLPAVEMMFKSPLSQELIRSGRESEIRDILDKEHTIYGSTSFNKALLDLTLSGKITEEQAYQYATNPASLKLMFSLSKENEPEPDLYSEVPTLKDEEKETEENTEADSAHFTGSRFNIR